MHFLILTNPHDLSIMWVFIKLLRLNVTFKQTCEYVFKTWHSELRSDFTKQSVNQSCQKPFFLFKFSICIQILLCEDFYLIMFTTTEILSFIERVMKGNKERKLEKGRKQKKMKQQLVFTLQRNCFFRKIRTVSRMTTRKKCLYPFYRNRRLPTALLQANSFIQGPFVELSRSGIINDSPLDSNIIF